MKPLQRVPGAALNGLQARGGSLASAVFMFLTLLCGVTQVFRRTDSLMSWDARLAWPVLVVSFGGGFVAKYAALLVTRRQFKRLCRALYRLCQRRRTGPRPSNSSRALPRNASIGL